MPLTKKARHTVTSSTIQTGHPSAARKGPSAASGWESETETHLIRLCLDLQLDAMLVALGAAATQSLPSTTRPTTAAAQDGAAQAPPWRRWVLEDVEMVWALAADVLGGGAALPAMLGSDLDQAVPAAAVDNLVARYESMVGLLADILPPDVSRSPLPYRAHAQEALARCQHRLRELSGTRLDQTPPRGVPLRHFTERPSVPGEWLG
jgi:hypothetical protein